MATDAKTTTYGSSYRADQPRQGERTSYAGDKGEAASSAKDRGAHAASDPIERAADEIEEAGRFVKEAGESALDRTRHAHDAICAFTRENPTAAVLIALGAGAMIARLLPRR